MTRDDVTQAVQQSVLEILPDVDAEQFSAAKSLRELGADSLDRAEVLSTSLEALSLTTPLHQLAKVNTLAELIDTLWDLTKT